MKKSISYPKLLWLKIKTEFAISPSSKFGYVVLFYFLLSVCYLLFAVGIVTHLIHL